MFKDQNILIISPEAWGLNFVSKHHYALTLAQQRNQVFFLNPPSASYSLSHTEYQDLFQINYKPFIKGLRYLPPSLQKWFIWQKYEKIQKIANCEFDMVWSFDNSVFYDFSALPEQVLKISHIVDLNQDFQTAKAASTADICFCTTEHIKKKLIKYNTNTFKIHHGYSPPTNDDSTLVSLPGTNTLKAVYIGNLSFPYIDWDLLLKLAEDNFDVDFVFVGPDGNSNLGNTACFSPAKEKLLSLTNTHLTGAVPHYSIPGILKKAGILLVAYKEEYHHYQASPHKFLEYLGSGKVIVATYTDEYKDKMALLVMSEVNEKVPQLFDMVKNNLTYYNSREKEDLRMTYALNNSYENQIEKIFTLVQYARK